MAFKRMKPARPAASAPAESQVKAELRKAAALLDRGQVEEAYEAADSLHRRFPKRQEPLLFLMDLAVEQDNGEAYEEALEPLLKLAPDNPEYALAHGRIAASDGFVALALERFRRFLERWPMHKEAPSIHKAALVLKEELGSMLDAAGIQHADRFELAARNDEIQSLIHRQRFEEARVLAQKVLDREPDYLPILNNMALLLISAAKWTEAASYAERALALDPENVFALSNMARISYMLGYKAEAALFARRIKASRSTTEDKTAKIIETLGYLCDDEGVLETYRQAMTDKDEICLESPLVHHLAGAAAMRLNQPDEARLYWTETLKLDPDFQMTQENLADSKLPIGERSGAWPFPFPYWVPNELFLEMAERLLEQAAASEEDPAEDVIRMTLEKHPYLETLAPILLERGDPPAREFAMFLAKGAQTPALLEALRDFALSRNGPDKIRMDAANTVFSAGLFESDTITLWVDGAQKEIMATGFEIHSESTGLHTERVEEIMEEALDAMYAKEGARAEQLLKQALEIEPDAPDILNNLANTYRLQDRNKDAVKLMAEISARFPDYFFGKINMIQLSLDENRLEDAENLLKPLRAQKRFHYSEFTALAQTQIQLLLKEGELDSARSWYSIWEQACPDHPSQEDFKRLLEKPFTGVTRRIGRRTRPQ